MSIIIIDGPLRLVNRSNQGCQIEFTLYAYQRSRLISLGIITKAINVYNKQSKNQRNKDFFLFLNIALGVHKIILIIIDNTHISIAALYIFMNLTQLSRINRNIFIDI